MNAEFKLGAPRDHLVHVIPDLQVNGTSGFAFTLATVLRNQFTHSLLFETPLDLVNIEMLWHMQAAGINVHNVDRITPEVIESLEPTGAILYNVVDRPDVGSVVPSIYYSYGVYDANTGADIVVPCSKYACTHRRTDDGDQTHLDPELVLPPMIQARQISRVKAPPHSFTVGILTSGSTGKYPCRDVVQLMSKLPTDVNVMVTTLPRYKHPGVQIAIDQRLANNPGKLMACPVRIHAPLRYVIFADVILYATPDGFNEPAGRLVVEALALGKPVICKRTGVFTEILENGVQALLYDSVDEAINHVQRIREDTGIANQLAANAQLWASWQDESVNIGKLKGILRMIGA